MATPLSASLQTVSGVTLIDIAILGSKKPEELLETDWERVGGAMEGTFNFTGDEQTVTEHKYENGQVFVSSTKDGTYGFEASIPDLSSAICERLLKMKTLASQTTGWLTGKTALAYGDNVATLENLAIRLNFEQGAYSSLVYPNASLSSRVAGAGSSEELVNIEMKSSAAKYSGAGIFKDQIFALVSRV